MSRSHRRGPVSKAMPQGDGAGERAQVFGALRAPMRWVLAGVQLEARPPPASEAKATVAKVWYPAFQ